MSKSKGSLHYPAPMRGDLVETTAADVCRELATHGASGILAIDGPDGPGRIVLREGRIIAAVSPTPRARLGDRLVGAGELDPDDLANALEAQRESGDAARLGSLLVERGLVRRDAVRVFVQEQVLDALFEIIRWRYGAYAFTPDDQDPPQGVPLSLSVDDALVEVARRQQEWDQLSQMIPDLEAVPSFRSGAATASASLEPDEFAVLASVDGERSVRSLAADLGYGEFEAARIVYGLSLLGIVDVRLPRDEIGAALEDALGLGEVEDLAGGSPATTDVEGHEPAEPAEPAELTEPAGLTEPADTQGEDPITDLDPDDAEPPEVWVSSEESREAGQPEAPVAEVADVGSDEPATELELEIEVEVDDTSDAAGQHDQGPTAPPPPPSEQPAEPLPGASILPPPPPGSTRSRDDAEGTGRPDEPPRDEPRRKSGLGRGLAAIIPPSAPGGADRSVDAAEPDGTEPDGTEPDGTEPRAGRDGGESPEATSAPTQRGDDNDVSEFLRELSRLSLDPPETAGAPKPPPRGGTSSSPPGSSGSSSEPSPGSPSKSTSSGSSSSSSTSGKSGTSKKKRRGLFGRG